MSTNWLWVDSDPIVIINLRSVSDIHLYPRDRAVKFFYISPDSDQNFERLLTGQATYNAVVEWLSDADDVCRIAVSDGCS